jgi:hypothetical protein
VHKIKRKVQIYGAILTFLIFYFSNPSPQSHFDYTFRIAEAFLSGRIGLVTTPPSWLNEFVPQGNNYYSVFPLGSVLTMLPAALLKKAGLISQMPSAALSAIAAALIWYLLIPIGEKCGAGLKRAALNTAAIIYGTWFWSNIVFAGAWQLALGFAALGECAAIYFTLVNKMPLLAGFFFSIAFGNRTELILSAPFFIACLVSDPLNPFDEETKPILSSKKGKHTATGQINFSGWKTFEYFKRLVLMVYEKPRKNLLFISQFLAFPSLLLFATFIYNYARFDSPFDFGYARIPGVLNEPWYRHGIFSMHYIPTQAWEMLLKPWHIISNFPYFLPDGFSSSILISSPFLIYCFVRKRNPQLAALSWITLVMITLIHWMHGNSGGWQFGYRYAIVSLPFIFLLLTSAERKKFTALEVSLYIFSFVANLWALWLFNWTSYLKI